MRFRIGGGQRYVRASGECRVLSDLELESDKLLGDEFVRKESRKHEGMELL